MKQITLQMVRKFSLRSVSQIDLTTSKSDKSSRLVDEIRWWVEEEVDCSEEPDRNFGTDLIMIRFGCNMLPWQLFPNYWVLTGMVQIKNKQKISRNVWSFLPHLQRTGSDVETIERYSVTHSIWVSFRWSSWSLQHNRRVCKRKRRRQIRRVCLRME